MYHGNHGNHEKSSGAITPGLFDLVELDIELIAGFEADEICRSSEI